jgi:DNA-directed RNA polymerase I subunit RPA49
MGAKASAGDDGDEDDGSVPDATDAALAEARKRVLPPFNVATNDKAKCYNVKGIVGEAERGALRRQLSALKGAGAEWQVPLQAAGAGWPALALEATRSSDADVAVDGLLLKHLTSLYLKPHKVFKQAALKEDAKALGMPADVLLSLLDKFAAKQQDGGGGGGDGGSAVWRVTKGLTDKLALHLLVLALKLGHFKVTTASLSKDLQMPPASVASLLRQVGCKVTSDKTNGGHVATLEAPLAFPGRRRKR